MNIRLVSDFLLTSAVINYAVLILWVALFIFAHDWMFRVHRRWFDLSAAQFEALNYGAIAVYKMGILLLNLVPFIALRIVTSHTR